MYTFEVTDESTLDVVTDHASYLRSRQILEQAEKQQLNGIGLFVTNQLVDVQDRLVRIKHPLTSNPEEIAGNIAATFYGLGRVAAEMNVNTPPVSVSMRVYAESYKFTLGARLSTELVESIKSIGARGRRRLQRDISMGTFRVARTILRDRYVGVTQPGSDFEFNSRVDADGWVSLSCPGNASGLDSETGISRTDKPEIRLYSHNVDSASQQIMLLGGLSVLSSGLES